MCYINISYHIYGYAHNKNIFIYYEARVWGNGDIDNQINGPTSAFESSRKIEFLINGPADFRRIYFCRSVHCFQICAYAWIRISEQMEAQPSHALLLYFYYLFFSTHK